MNALFLVGPCHGHINASFGLAAILKKNGFQITYALGERFREKIEHNNFNFSRLTSEVTGGAQKTAELYEILIKRIKLTTNFHRLNKLHWLITNKEIDKLLGEDNFQLLIVDTSTIFYALLGISRGYKVLILNPLISENYDKKVPPYFSKYIPGNPFIDLFVVTAIWHAWLMKRRIFNYVRHKLITPSDYFYIPHILKKLELDKNIINEKRVWMPGVHGTPELLFYTKEFDFPRSNNEDEWYVGPLVYKDRKEPHNFDWEKIDIHKQLIYCSLGTLTKSNYGKFFNLLRKIIEVFEGNDSYELLISSGGENWEEELKSKARNIHIYHNLPQLEILNCASLMINHGGGNSVRECILKGVPMLSIPLSKYTDQYGFAARVLYHKIGMIGNKKDSKKVIMNKCFEVLNNPIYKENILRMQSSFIKCQDGEPKLIKSILSYMES